MKKASLSSLKVNNALLIFESLRNNGPMSRANIARRTHLMPSTVSYITSLLLEKKILKEKGSEEVSRVGKKGVLLDINYEDFLFLGYDVGSAYSRVIVSNGKGDIQYSKRFKSEKNDSLLKQIHENIQVVNEKFNIKGVGMAFPGYVNPEKGIVVRAHNLDISNFDVKKVMKKDFNLPAYVDHNTIMMARNLISNNSHKEKNFCIINIGPGIGVGIVNDGKILRGYRNAAGELGHITINSDGRKCNCGKKGCLETESSSKAIVKTYEELSGENLNCKGNCDSSIVYKLAEDGNKKAIKAFERAGHYLGLGIASLVNIVNPEKVYIAGGVSYGWKYLKSSVEKSYKENIFYANRDVKLELPSIGEYITALGASTFAFEKYIKEELISRKL